MKTQIIQVEAHDDTISVKDKIEWSQTHRILLVWPARKKVLHNRLDLVVLERHCASLGSQLAIVTGSPEIRFHARQLGIPVYSTKKEAQLQSWRRSWLLYRRRRLQKNARETREKPLPPLPRADQKIIPIPLIGRLAIFSVSVAAVLAIAAFLFPSAEVNLPPRLKEVVITIPVQASPDISTVQVSGLVPAREMVASVEKRAAREVSGSLEIPDTFAEGEVTFTNLTPETISIPENTLVSTGGDSPVYYTTLEKVVLPAGVGEETTARIRAVNPGPSGNQEPFAITAVGTNLGTNLTVSNPAAIRGGRNTNLPAPSSQDREELRKNVLAELTDHAQDAMRENAKPGDQFLSTQPTIKEIELEQFTPGENQAGDQLELIMRIQFSSWIVREEDLEKLGREVMSSHQEDGYSPIPESLEIQQGNVADPGSPDRGNWDMTVRWREKMSWDPKEVIELVLGVKPSLAKEQLRQKYHLDGDPEIILKPSWWPRLPFLPFRITIGE